ncbi:hypothetical protein R5R35_012898 [Gryllus longicercus]|uniref:Protein quiver n=2 Tax=Gryllus longicercus TaxID=2509291 RepID=A0AAN9ZB15_9ORTH
MEVRAATKSMAATMASSAFSSVCVLLAILLSFLIKENEAVKCYICSWSPHDNRSDTCTKNNFIPEYTMVHDCEKGCEVVSMRDPNGAMEMFYRNCYTKSENDLKFDRRNTGINEEEVYKCNWKLCNGAVSVFTSQSVLLLTFTAAWCILFCGQ